MKKKKEIEKFVANATVHSNPEVNQRVLNDLLEQIEKARNDTQVASCSKDRRNIMKSPVTKFAAAAVIAIAVFIGIKGFNGTTAWAKVIKAFNDADNIHIVTKVTRSNGQVWEIRSWLKKRTMLRDESTEEIAIDDGENRLTLDRQEKTEH